MNFDEWRDRYNAMSYQEHVTFYDEIFKAYPVQQHFDSESARKFLAQVDARDVIEIGGWRGELADQMLKEFPAITRWVNWDICRGATISSVPTDSRYEANHPERWLWEVPNLFTGFDTFVASHVIEHMRAAELEKLVANMGDINQIFLASPLSNEPTNWAGYNGTHILEVGWNGVTEIMGDYGFYPMKKPLTYEVRTYKKP